jgi:hypothetical protein
MLMYLRAAFETDSSEHAPAEAECTGQPPTLSKLIESTASRPLVPKAWRGYRISNFFSAYQKWAKEMNVAMGHMDKGTQLKLTISSALAKAIGRATVAGTVNCESGIGVCRVNGVDRVWVHPELLRATLRRAFPDDGDPSAPRLRDPVVGLPRWSAQELGVSVWPDLVEGAPAVFPRVSVDRSGHPPRGPPSEPAFDDEDNVYMLVEGAEEALLAEYAECAQAYQREQERVACIWAGAYSAAGAAVAGGKRRREVSGAGCGSGESAGAASGVGKRARFVDLTIDA